MANTFMETVKGQLIISCQALPEEPLHSSFIMARMARAAKMAGAVALRANSVVDVQAIQDETGLPIIGIIKQNYADSKTFITPTIKEMRAIAATGVPVVATQVTGQRRPDNEQLATIVAQFRKEFPETLLMADTATLDNVREADDLGFDIIGTTMHGYTDDTQGLNIADNNFDYLKKVVKAAQHPVIAEGKIDTPAKAAEVLNLGVHAVVVGSAITRPLEIAKGFIAAVAER
ncbi:N-acetylmannosamine-6-phosphate 2-epimerase [Secundilactobacillus kimchicus]|nr:N-acetylmannosamine-6-phosphate 2-epimerase [Secundilactobacillus kimchicus]